MLRELYRLAYDHLTWSAVEALLPRQEPWRILDAGGAGSTAYSIRMAVRGHHVTVLDPSPGSLAQARARFDEQGLEAHATFLHGNILSLPFPDQSFDLVFCEGDSVSCCVDDYPRAISELVRVAVTKGFVVMGLDSRYEHFTGALRAGRKSEALSILLNGTSTCTSGPPVHAFTLKELVASTERAGAEVVEIFGKPVMLVEMLEALTSARGPEFDPWESRHEILELQHRLAHEGYASSGGRLQIMARRR